MGRIRGDRVPGHCEHGNVGRAVGKGARPIEVDVFLLGILADNPGFFAFSHERRQHAARCDVILELQPVANHVINPKFELNEGEIESTEGCLSVPGYVGEITRYERVAVTGFDRTGEKIRLEGDGLFARCLQHEIDHLNGVLYIDRAKNVRKPETEEEHEIAEEAAAARDAWPCSVAVREHPGTGLRRKGGEWEDDG